MRGQPIDRVESLWPRLLSLVLLLLVGGFCHTSIRPVRWYAADLAILLPLAICFALGVLMKHVVWRVAYGAMQGVVLLAIYWNVVEAQSDIDISALKPSRTWLVLSGFVFVYAVAFGLTTALVRCAGRWRRVVPGHCAVCGYDLCGLPERRCPECGAGF